MSIRCGHTHIPQTISANLRGGPLGLVAVLSDAASIVRYLRGVGLAAEPPATAAASPPPQRELDLVF